MFRTLFHNKLETVMLFLVTLVVSLVIFGIMNQKQHDRILKADYYACLQSRQVARNQRRVIIALLTLEGDEPAAGKEHIQDIALLQEALASVPEFDCRR